MSAETDPYKPLLPGTGEKATVYRGAQAPLVDVLVGGFTVNLSVGITAVSFIHPEGGRTTVPWHAITGIEWGRPKPEPEAWARP